MSSDFRRLLLPSFPKETKPRFVAAVYDRRKQTQLDVQRRKLTVEALCERLLGTIRQSQTAATAIIRAVARSDSWESQRPHLTKISVVANQPGA